MSEQNHCNVDVYDSVDYNTFQNIIYPLRRPAVLRGCDIGDATLLWKDAEYLKTAGSGKDVVAHVSDVPQLDFIKKNFSYRTMSFAELVEKSSEYTTRGQPISEAPPKYYYLRSIGINPRKDIANIKNDFPHLAKDLKVPDFVPEDRFFSSVFRIGSPGVQLWTHYDVMDNVLIQVVGRKRVVLFPPSELDKMYLCGDKSQVLDIDATKSEQFPHFKDALRMEHILEAGDVLFIPALWFHNVISIDFGVAVNVFWKHLDDSMYDGKDVYGNKDLVPAARAQQSVNHALKVLHELPDEYCQFYAQKLITNMNSKIGISK